MNLDTDKWNQWLDSFVSNPPTTIGVDVVGPDVYVPNPVPWVRVVSLTPTTNGAQQLRVQSRAMCPFLDCEAIIDWLSRHPSDGQIMYMSSTRLIPSAVYLSERYGRSISIRQVDKETRLLRCTVGPAACPRPGYTPTPVEIEFPEQLAELMNRNVDFMYTTPDAVCHMGMFGGMFGGTRRSFSRVGNVIHVTNPVFVPSDAVKWEAEGSPERTNTIGAFFGSIKGPGVYMQVFITPAAAGPNGESPFEYPRWLPCLPCKDDSHRDDNDDPVTYELRRVGMGGADSSGGYAEQVIVYVYKKSDGVDVWMNDLYGMPRGLRYGRLILTDATIDTKKYTHVTPLDIRGDGKTYVMRN
jgi:hypothetical protein